MYERILPLPDGFADAEATSVGNLRDAWVDQRGSLAEGGALSTFNERLLRRWSIETGIIERLYTLDRGTTELLVNQGLDAALVEHGSSDLPSTELVAILKDHREAAEYVVDHVRQQRGLTTHLIRSIHALLTRSQDFVEAEDQFGRMIRTPLRRGEWKQVPNNPRRQDGTLHEYCPPQIVSEEIDRLLENFKVISSVNTPAVIKAAWLHHRFTQIHPFQDGNGRTARALTALVFVTDNCFPIVVDRDLRDQYINALEEADGGELKSLVRLFAMLEKRELEQALSISEDVLTETPQPGGVLRAKLLLALRERARANRLSVTERRRQVIAVGQAMFAKVVRPLVQDLSSELQHILDEELPGSNVRVEISDAEKRHWFKTQIVHIAQQEGYYGDFETAHEWVRLRLERPGDAGTAVNEVVISMHSLGRHFTGVLVLSAYFATRFIDEDGRSVTLDPQKLAERSLTFSYMEDETNIFYRASEWSNSVLNIGIAQLQKVM